jgi:hypothetical protein
MYLQATIDVSRAFYGNNDASARAWKAFIADVENAPALLIEKVVAPAAMGVAKLGGRTIWAVIKGLWPILLLILVVVIGYSVATRRLSK